MPNEYHSLKSLLPVEWNSVRLSGPTHGWNRDQNCTQNSAKGHFFVCLNPSLVHFFQSDLFEMYRTSCLLPPLCAFACIFTVRNVVAERLFSQASVILFTGRGVCIPACTGGDTPWQTLQRTACILLECILVGVNIFTCPGFLVKVR